MGYASVSEYVNSLEEGKRRDVNEFIAFMNTEFPELTAKICFSMPMWWTGAKMYDGYVAISAAGKHYSIHFCEESYLQRLKEILPDCSFGKRCVNIKYGDKPSVSAVRQSVKDYLGSILRA